MTWRTFRIVLLAAWGAVAVGCGGGASGAALKLVPVSGFVSYKGVPVEGAIVSFMTDGAPRTATGKTDAKGAFRLTTMQTDDGAAIGEHQVTIVKQSSPSGTQAFNPETINPDDYAKMLASGKPLVELQDLLPVRYANPATSGLTRKVIEGERNEFQFDLAD